MTDRPRLRTEGSLVPGLAAVALFVVLAAVFLNATFPTPVGFEATSAVTKSLGAAMFDIAPGPLMGEDETAIPSEGFLVAFILIAVVLDAALDGSVMLAKRDDDESVATDGGHDSGGEDA